MDIKTLAKSNQRVNLSVLDAERGVASWATLNCNPRVKRAPSVRLLLFSTATRASGSG